MTPDDMKIILRTKLPKPAVDWREYEPPQFDNKVDWIKAKFSPNPEMQIIKFDDNTKVVDILEQMKNNWSKLDIELKVGKKAVAQLRYRESDAT
jgi:hypothetical protein